MRRTATKKLKVRSKKLYWDGNKEHAVDTVVIRDGITEIEYKSFEGCEKLEKIILPEGLTSIDGYAFYGCRSLKEIVLPKGLRKSTEIAQKKFRRTFDRNEILSATIPCQ